MDYFKDKMDHFDLNFDKKIPKKVISVENKQLALERHQIGLLRRYSCISVTKSVLKHQHVNSKRFIEFLH